MGAMQLGHRSRRGPAHHLSSRCLWLCQPPQHYPSGNTIACRKPFLETELFLFLFCFRCVLLAILGCKCLWIAFDVLGSALNVIERALELFWNGKRTWAQNMVLGQNWTSVRPYWESRVVVSPVVTHLEQRRGHHQDSLVGPLDSNNKLVSFSLWQKRENVSIYRTAGLGSQYVDLELFLAFCLFYRRKVLVVLFVFGSERNKHHARPGTAWTHNSSWPWLVVHEFNLANTSVICGAPCPFVLIL